MRKWDWPTGAKQRDKSDCWVEREKQGQFFTVLEDQRKCNGALVQEKL